MAGWTFSVTLHLWRQSYKTRLILLCKDFKANCYISLRLFTGIQLSGRWLERELVKRVKLGKVNTDYFRLVLHFGDSESSVSKVTRSVSAGFTLTVITPKSRFTGSLNLRNK